MMPLFNALLCYVIITSNVLIRWPIFVLSPSFKISVDKNAEECHVLGTIIIPDSLKPRISSHPVSQTLNLYFASFLVVASCVTLPYVVIVRPMQMCACTRLSWRSARKTLPVSPQPHHMPFHAIFLCLCSCTCICIWRVCSFPITSLYIRCGLSSCNMLFGLQVKPKTKFAWKSWKLL